MSAQTSDKTEDANSTKSLVQPGITHRIYNDPGADFVIEVRDAPNYKTKVATLTEFRVHKAALAAASSIFADLFDTRKEGEDAKKLKVDGDSKVWEILLHNAYRRAEEFKPLEDLTTDPLVELWKLALHYNMPTLYYYAEATLHWRLPTMHVTTAFGLYSEASSRERSSLAKAALAKAKEGRFRDFPVKCLEKLGSAALVADFCETLFERDAFDLKNISMQIGVAESLSKEANVKEHLVSAKRNLAKITRARPMVAQTSNHQSIEQQDDPKAKDIAAIGSNSDSRQDSDSDEDPESEEDEEDEDSEDDADATSVGTLIRNTRVSLDSD